MSWGKQPDSFKNEDEREGNENNIKNYEYKTECPTFNSLKESVLNPVAKNEDKLLYTLNFNMNANTYYPSMDPKAMVFY